MTDRVESGRASRSLTACAELSDDDHDDEVERVGHGEDERSRFLEFRRTFNDIWQGRYSIQQLRTELRREVGCVLILALLLLFLFYLQQSAPTAFTRTVIDAPPTQESLVIPIKQYDTMHWGSSGVNSRNTFSSSYGHVIPKQPIRQPMPRTRNGRVWLGRTHIYVDTPSTLEAFSLQGDRASPAWSVPLSVLNAQENPSLSQEVASVLIASSATHEDVLLVFTRAVAQGGSTVFQVHVLDSHARELAQHDLGVAWSSMAAALTPDNDLVILAWLDDDRRTPVDARFLLQRVTVPWNNEQQASVVWSTTPPLSPCSVKSSAPQLQVSDSTVYAASGCGDQYERAQPRPSNRTGALPEHRTRHPTHTRYQLVACSMHTGEYLWKGNGAWVAMSVMSMVGKLALDSCLRPTCDVIVASQDRLVCRIHPHTGESLWCTQLPVHCQISVGSHRTSPTLSHLHSAAYVSHSCDVPQAGAYYSLVRAYSLRNGSVLWQSPKRFMSPAPQPVLVHSRTRIHAPPAHDHALAARSPAPLPARAPAPGASHPPAKPVEDAGGFPGGGTSTHSSALLVHFSETGYGSNFLMLQPVTGARLATLHVQDVAPTYIYADSHYNLYFRTDNPGGEADGKAVDPDVQAGGGGEGYGPTGSGPGTAQAGQGGGFMLLPAHALKATSTKAAPLPAPL